MKLLLLTVTCLLVGGCFNPKEDSKDAENGLEDASVKDFGDLDIKLDEGAAPNG